MVGPTKRKNANKRGIGKKIGQKGMHDDRQWPSLHRKNVWGCNTLRAPAGVGHRRKNSLTMGGGERKEDLTGQHALNARGRGHPRLQKTHPAVDRKRRSWSSGMPGRRKRPKQRAKKKRVGEHGPASGNNPWREEKCGIRARKKKQRNVNWTEEKYATREGNTKGPEPQSSGSNRVKRHQNKRQACSRKAHS